LAQSILMTQVLKGEALATGDVAQTVAVCAALAVLALAYVARTLRSAALK